MEPMDDLATLPPELAPEPPPKGPWVWARDNLFSSVFNSILSVIAIVIVALAIRGMLGWIFSTGRNWAAVATNLRFYMTHSYPESQYVRVWVAVGVIVALAGLTQAFWRVGAQIAVDRLTKTLQAGAGLLAVAALLGPPNISSAIDLPFVSFVIEAVAMQGGRLTVFLIAAAVFGSAWLVQRSMGERAKEVTFHTLWLLAAATVFGIAVVWLWPFGRYTFSEGQAMFEPGTVSSSTKIPITVLAIVGPASYFAGRALLAVINEKILKQVVLLGWLLSLPMVILVILRDPDWTLITGGGGFDFLGATDFLVLLAFGIGGTALIGFLSLPRLGEAGKVGAALLLVGSLAMWLVPMLVRIRLLGLLLALFALGASTFAGDRRSRIRYLGLWVGMVAILVYFLAAINTPSTVIVPGKSFLGGLTLTFVLALTSIFLSFPIGVLMALGRTSTMPIFRMMSTVYIEMVRGIPFITVLIFFDLILVLFLPEGVEFDSVTLAILAGTLFSAAYLAENVRGGLQAIPKGQYEAAKAMGLSTLQLTVFIVLPQALRAVIPALVGQTIAIFKDTSLVAIIGLFDFLFIADKVIPAQTIFLGVRLENLLFIAGGYWIFTFTFSRASLRLEKKVGLGER